MAKLVTQSLRAALLVLFTVSGASGGALAPYNYFGEIKRKYPVVLTVKISSAKTVTSGDYVCSYDYSAKVTDVVRGKHETLDFSFLSLVGLTIGEEYLVYFSEEDAKLPRYLFMTPTGQQQACSRQMAGYFLLYNETNLVKEAPDGTTLRRVVQFSDGWADYPIGLAVTEVVHSADFNFVRNELKTD